MCPGRRPDDVHEAVSAKKRVPTPPTSCYDRSHQISEHIFEGREKVKKEKRKRERRRKERREDLASCFVVVADCGCVGWFCFVNCE